MKLHKNFGEMKNVVEPHEKRYCSYCGALCIEQLIGAEFNLTYYGYCHTGSIAPRYDVLSGERNYCYKYICPNYKERKWFQEFSPHDSYFCDEIIKI